MKNFDVRIVSKDIINGEPLATCVVTYDDLYFHTVRYNYFTSRCEPTDILDPGKVYRIFNIHYSRQYDAIMTEMNEAVKEAIRKNIV